MGDGGWSGVAGRLLQERFLLTALELHTELVEAGREEPQLREFFSNPANFGGMSPSTVSMVRCPSQATLDSLDLTRLSEDGERATADDVAVLEFELRKARDTINALRANLTRAAECDSTDTQLNTQHLNVKPHERRALNFLVYEYLLQQDCKLTSITFSDEVPDQDFECWDDVGLNTPRPCDLLSLYRREPSNHVKESFDVETQTDDLKQTVVVVEENEEVLFLKKQILALETDKVNYQKLYDAALASLNSLTSPTSDVPSSETTLYNRDDDSVEVVASSGVGTDFSPGADDETQPLPQTATQNYYGSSVSTESLTPDRFEMIDSDKNGSSNRDESNVSSYEPIIIEEQILNSPLPYTVSQHKSSITTLDDTISLNEHADSEWERRKTSSFYKNLNVDSAVGSKTEAWIDSDLHSEYKEALINFCDLQYTKENTYFKDIPCTNQPVSLQDFVSVVSLALPKIIPNILLVKRDEVISLLICTIYLHPEQSQRDKLLQLLLTFKKKMEKEDRALIISGLVILLKWNSEYNCGLDSDFLGFFWEMLSSKSAEKRLLGAEASVALAPYISLDLVNSLLLSMVLSMCDSNDNAIRKQGFLGALLITPTATSTKYSQLENIFFNMAFDLHFSEMCIKTYAPILARSTLLNGTFHSEFYPHLLDKLTSKNSNQIDSVIVILKILNSIVIFNLFYVINVDIVKISKIQSSESSILKPWLSEYLNDRPFHSPHYLFKNEVVNPFELIQSFYNITESDYNIAWDEREWFINQCLKKILDALAGQPFPVTENTINACVDLFETFCNMFGASFTKYIVKPTLNDELNKIEQKMIKSDFQNKSSLVLLSIYLGISTSDDDNRNEVITATINRWSICCGMCTISPQFIGVPIVRYSHTRPDLLECALSAMRQCIIHSSEQVRAFIACLFEYLVQYSTLNEGTVKTSIVPAIVTLVGDASVSVKCNAIKSLGEVISRPKLSQDASEKCWLTLEDLVIEEKTNGSLGAHVTTCLAKTFHKISTNNNQSNKVLPNLVMLCYSPVFSADNTTAINSLLSELLPAFQSATQYDISEHFVNNSLLPALRKFESLNQKILSEHKLTIESLVHKLTIHEHGVAHHPSVSGHSLPAILANSESVGRRVTQMFQHSKPAMNLQNIFKKK